MAKGLRRWRWLCLVAFGVVDAQRIVPSRASTVGGKQLTFEPPFGTLFSNAYYYANFTADEQSAFTWAFFVNETNLVAWAPYVDIGSRDITELPASIFLNRWNETEYAQIAEYSFAFTVRRLRVMYLYHGAISDFGWNYNWNARRLTTARRYGPYIEVDYRESLALDVFDVVRSLCLQNYDVVVGTSSGFFLDSMLKSSLLDECNLTYLLQYATTSVQSPTLRTFNTKIYQLRDSTGVLAGTQMLEMSSNVAAYLARAKEALRDVNAFALGCRSVNPDCVVKVLLTAEDCWVEQMAAMKLWVEDKARVLSSDCERGLSVFNEGPCADNSSVYCMDEAEVLANAVFGSVGYGIGHNADMQLFVGDSVLTSVSETWDSSVSYSLQQIYESEWDAEDFYKGTDEDPTINTLADFSPRVSPAAREAAQKAYDTLQSGEDEVFCGFERADGVQAPCDDSRCCLSTSSILAMDYFVEGVEWASSGSGKWGTVLDNQYVPPPRIYDDADASALCPAGQVLAKQHVHCEAEDKEGAQADSEPKENFHYLSSALKSFMLSLAAINILFATVCVVWTFYYRERVILKLSQPCYLYTLCGGCCVTTLSSLAPILMGDTCQLMLWLYGAGFVLTTASLYAKMQQMKGVVECSLSFSKVKSSTIQTKRLEVFFVYFTMAAGEVLILLIWWFVAPLRYKRSCTEKEKGGFFDGDCLESAGKCRMRHLRGGEIMVAALAGYHMSCVLAGIHMCYLVRNLPSVMAEGKWVFTGFYSQLQVFVTAVPVLAVISDDYETFTFLKSLVICVGDLTTLSMIYIPKMLLIYKYHDFDKQAITTFVLKSLTNTTQHDTVYEQLRISNNCTSPPPSSRELVQLSGMRLLVDTTPGPPSPVKRQSTCRSPLRQGSTRIPEPPVVITSSRSPLRPGSVRIPELPITSSAVGTTRNHARKSPDLDSSARQLLRLDSESEL